MGGIFGGRVGRGGSQGYSGREQEVGWDPSLVPDPISPAASGSSALFRRWHRSKCKGKGFSLPHDSSGAPLSVALDAVQARQPVCSSPS